MSGVLDGLEPAAVARLLSLVDGFHPRAARPLGARTISGHRLKGYALQAPGRLVPDAILERLQGTVEAVLETHRSIGTCGLGFVIVHAGGDGDYLLVQTWSSAYMSQLSILTSPPDAPDELRLAPAPLSACAWEARIIAHERDAFTSAVLGGAGPLDDRIERWERDVLPDGDIS